MKQFVCYCFEHTEDDIRRDVLENAGRSAILEKILAAKNTRSDGDVWGTSAVSWMLQKGTCR